MSLSNKGLLITGTDTGVGKTVVAAALAAAFAARGLRVGVMKPVESGCARVDGRLVPADTLFLREAAGSDDPLSLVNPYPLERPIAPALAAEMEGVRINTANLRLAYETIAASHDVVVVEGAGGLLAPLYGDETILGLASALGLPVLVVARNVLGTINHTALTVRACRSAGVGLAGIVLNNMNALADESASSNAAALRRWGGAPVLGQIPHLPSLDIAALLAAAEQYVDVGALLKYILAPQMAAF